MQGTRDRLIRYLEDAHAAETGIIDALEGFIGDSSNEEIVRMYQEHQAQTRSQAMRLEQRLVALGGDTSRGKGFLNSMMAKASDVLNASHDDYDKETQNLIKAYSTEHMERGMYASLMAYAQRMGDTETAGLAREIMMEEERMAERLYPFIEECARRTYDAAALDAA